MIAEVLIAYKWPITIIVLSCIFRELVMKVVPERDVNLKYNNGSLELSLNQIQEKAQKYVEKSIDHSLALDDSKQNQILYKNFEVELPELVSKKDNQSISDILTIAHNNPIGAINKISENFREDLYKLIDFYGDLTNLSYEGDTVHCLNVLRNNGVITKQTHSAALSFYNLFIMIDLQSDFITKDFIESKVRDYKILSVEILTNIKNEMAQKLKDLES
ncbi:hypothetical protein MHB38_06055 [Bacillus sp. FSL K6-3176]|uniref:hypothetical protein n=1 Tax=Bacillus sp. FSL K6-3176 TaxID=2921493 RepID=UPI0030F8B579